MPRIIKRCNFNSKTFLYINIGVWKKIINPKNEHNPDFILGTQIFEIQIKQI